MSLDAGEHTQGETVGRRKVEMGGGCVCSHTSRQSRWCCHSHQNTRDNSNEDAIRVDPHRPLSEEQLNRDDGEAVQDRVPSEHCCQLSLVSVRGVTHSPMMRIG